MKITAIIGSPHLNGNSATIARAVHDILVKSGAEAKTFELNQFSYRGCQGCMACKTSWEKCIMKDGLEPVLEDIKSSEVTILASPVYFGDVAAQTKGLIDRFYSYYKNDFRTNPKPSRLAEGKKLVFILTQGSPDEKIFSDIIPRYSRMFERLGFTSIFPICAFGVGPVSDVLKNETIGRAIRETAEKIIAG
jgi:multimeric flavodoxin WrbA